MNRKYVISCFNQNFQWLISSEEKTSKLDLWHFGFLWLFFSREWHWKCTISKSIKIVVFKKKVEDMLGTFEKNSSSPFPWESCMGRHTCGCGDTGGAVLLTGHLPRGGIPGDHLSTEFLREGAWRGDEDQAWHSSKERRHTRLHQAACTLTKMRGGCVRRAMFSR